MSSGQRAVTCDLARGLARAALLLLLHFDLSGHPQTLSPSVAACGDGSERRAEAPGSQGPRSRTASSAPPDPHPAPTPAGCSGGALSRRPEYRVPKGQRDAEAPVPPGERGWQRRGGPAGWDRRGGCGGASKPPRHFCEGEVLGKALLWVDETGFYFWPKPRGATALKCPALWAAGEWAGPPSVHLLPRQRAGGGANPCGFRHQLPKPPDHGSSPGAGGEQRK